MSNGTNYGNPNQGNPNQNYGNSPNQNYGDPNQGYTPPRDYGDPNPGYGDQPTKPQPPPYENKCKSKPDKEKPTYFSLVKERRVICDLVFETQGTAAQLKEKHDRDKELLEEKQCLFRKTEGNYQRYRNFDIIYGTELLQFNDSVKTSITAYGKTFKDLNDTLKSIAKAAKDLKAKVTDLKEAGSKLYNCVNDDCNKTQRRAITGSAPGCDPGTVIPICTDSANILDELIYRPLGFLKDVDSIFKSSYEVVGIQTFSSVESLDSMQKKLDEQAKKFEKHIAETAKTREGDVKSLKDDLVKAVQEVEKDWIDLNFQRSLYEGYRDAAAFLCKPDCKCVVPTPVDTYKDRQPHSGARLDNCQKRICEICKIVDNTFCCVPVQTSTTTPAPRTPRSA